MSANQDQAAHWGRAQKWVDLQPWLDQLMEPVLLRLLKETAPKAGERILDIGCGTGDSSLRFAAEVGSDGHVTGADISELLLEVSRFGVMFFDDSVAAFANMRRATRPGGRMVFLAWASMAQNPWFRLPYEVAVDHMGSMSSGDPKAPGPMRFADQGYVGDLVRDGGWNEVEVSEVMLDLTPPGGAKDMADFACRVGVVSRLVEEKGGTAKDVAAIETKVATALERYETPEGGRVPAVLNLVTAVKTAG